MAKMACSALLGLGFLLIRKVVTLNDLDVTHHLFTSLFELCNIVRPSQQQLSFCYV